LEFTFELNIWNVVGGIMAFFLIRELHSNTKAHQDIVKKFEALTEKFETLIGNEKEKRLALEKETVNRIVSMERDVDFRFHANDLKFEKYDHKIDQVEINILTILALVMPEKKAEIMAKIEEKNRRRKERKNEKD